MTRKRHVPKVTPRDRKSLTRRRPRKQSKTPFCLSHIRPDQIMFASDFPIGKVTTPVNMGHFLATLKSVRFSHYVIEFPPVSSDTISTTPFTFVVTEKRALARQKPSGAAFKEHMPKSGIAQFPSLSDESVLTVPARHKHLDYSSVGPFTKRAPLGQQRKLWTAAFNGLIRAASEHCGEMFWLSTSGFAVPWLHIRIDPSPKYYTYEPFTRK